MLSPLSCCYSRKRWLQQMKVKEEEEKKAKALLANDGDDGNDPTDDSETPNDANDDLNNDGNDTNLGVGNDVETMLAACMNLTQDNPNVRDAIVDAISRLHNCT